MFVRKTREHCKTVLFAISCLLLAACGSNQEGSSAAPASQEAPNAKELWERAEFLRENPEKADNPACSGIIVPDQEGFDKRIALTFDDGPNPRTTPEVMEVLNEHDAPATFFAKGRNVAANPETYEDVVDEGFTVGTHSYNHPDFRQLSREEAKWQFDRTQELMTEHGPAPKYVRFPYGAANCGMVDLAESYGYRVTGWHIDSADWCFGTGTEGYCSESTYGGMPDRHRDSMIEYMLSQAEANNGGIVLFHDSKHYTADQLDRILTRLEEEGYTFVDLDNRDAFPKLNRVDESEGFAWHGSTCEAGAESDTCGYMDRAGCHSYTVNESDNQPRETGFCTAPCQGYCEDMPGKATTFCAKLSADDEMGRCVSKAEPVNQDCDAITGAEPVVVDRFVGDSGVPEAEATVCLPAQ